ncbi:cation:proton antiporter [Actinoplanes friuliensis]|uniref:Putative sodium/proton antiporter n=1 Tax=Actinoplanes friuliensis DSM 7358 TaxID=1246995 RepID=U5VQ37_9ACTN|nr:sodium:proton antiporter [Actinoplanes friuliensis]AGZ38924.1 putative sodium/proton antiporter [Actinoplanes friuliensis DSM 7358]
MNGVQILLIIGAGIGISALAHRRGLQPGLIVVTLAAGVSFIPGVPRLELESELMLAIVVPPLLYSATRGASFTAFGRNFRAIFNLGVLLVVLTAGALGALSTWLLPTIGLAAAFVLGSVLAPPDTITTVTHGDELGLPKRVTTILTGESLVNDATALTLFSIAVAAVSGEHTTWGGGILEFFRNASIGAGIGGLLAIATLTLRKMLRNPTLETSLGLLVPFTAFLLAEQVHASGIIAVVVAAFSISINTSLDPRHQYPNAYRTRLQEDAFWPVVDFLLETFVFAYIGLQLKFVLEDLAAEEDPGLTRTLVAAGVLLLAAIVLRLTGVYALFGWWQLGDRNTKAKLARSPEFAERLNERRTRGRRNRRPREMPLDAPNARETMVVGWTGMRGILTLAAAASVPEMLANGEEFPGRSAIQAIALIVTLGTLLIQGTTIRRLVGLLHLDTSGERREAEEMRTRGVEVMTAAAPARDGGPTTDDYEKQRTAISTAVSDGTLDEETGRGLISDIDLRQAAAQASS